MLIEKQGKTYLIIKTSFCTSYLTPSCVLAKQETNQIHIFKTYLIIQFLYVSDNTDFLRARLAVKVKEIRMHH